MPQGSRGARSKGSTYFPHFNSILCSIHACIYAGRCVKCSAATAVANWFCIESYRGRRSGRICISDWEGITWRQETEKSAF
ncbi:hypothetical protein BRADI_2g32907v3 [Brachypodium distachyon]|uniref:Uncharacterized protein n=1 Tax=Brachypodium distachyon TaxID=15368 RepID=A0A2K2DBI7_BRADI|nr:hypothetical protein BRADI_2g32907v3 [Brachypodium distachyon]